MGEVYRARDTRLGREVAIKVLPEELTNDRDRLARFEREARSASALNHRNIVTIHDFTADGGEAWMVMELIRGESLRDAINRGAIPQKRLLAIATGIADGLAVAHTAGLVHRDLKPENIMIAVDGTPKILDFGLVKPPPMPEETNAPTTPQVSRTGVVLGTTAYMSPEQARGADVDARTDQFSFGVMVYEMATGRNPFRRGSTMETIAAILSDEPPPLHEPFGWIVERCLQKNPVDRYGSTADLAHDLRIAPAALAVRSDKSVGATWPWMLATAVLLITLIIAALLRPKTRPAAPVQAAIPTPQIVTVNMREICPPVAISPDGRYVIIDGAATDGTNALWLSDLRTGTTKPLAGTENAYGFAWSADSNAIAYCAGGKLKSMSLDGTPPRTICDALPPCMPSWSGGAILFAEQTGLSIVSAQGGTPTMLIKAQRVGDINIWPYILSDQKHFLYISGIRRNEQIEHELMAATLDGASPVRIASIDSRVMFANGRLLYVRDGTLVAQPFDASKLKLSGEPHALIDDLYYFRSTGVAGFSVSESGTLVWRTGRHPSRQVWINRSGMEIGSVGRGLFGAGRLSPNGDRYAAAVFDRAVGNSDIWIYNLNRTTSERLTYTPTFENNPIWSPDGKTIYYLSDVLGPPDIFRWNLGDDHPTLIYRGPYVEQPEDVSPDGKYLLFVQYTSSFTGRVAVLPLTPPGEARLLTAAPFNSWSPRFSPDGKRVAYESDLSGAPEVYVRPFEGSSQPMRVSTNGGTRPRWRTDGRELFYLGPDGRFMSVPVEPSGALGAPRMLFQASNTVDFQPAADGSRFLVQLDERSLDPPVHLLINWPSRLNSQ
jgi:Tol biopolymer transport system component